MVGLVVKNMSESLEFYRRLGIELPVTADSEKFVMHRMDSGVTLFWDTVSGPTTRLATSPPADTEFFLSDSEAVDAKYEELVGFGYHGRTAPAQTFGPYAAMVDDPDGNVILITAG